MSAAPHNAAAGYKPSTKPSNKRARADRYADQSGDSGSDQPTQSSAHAAPVTRLYRHALESIFAFLMLAELSRVLGVSRSWSAAVRSTPSIGAEVYRPRVPPSVIAACGLVSHISGFGSSQRPIQVDSNSLLVVRQHFSSLSSLSCRVWMPQPTPLLFSSKLRTLRVTLLGPDEDGYGSEDVCAATAESIQTTCSSVAFLHSLPRLRTMELHVDSQHISADDVVAGLACCPGLSTLALDAPVKAAHMSAILSGLPLLTDLSLVHCRQLESLAFFADWAHRAALQMLSIVISGSYWSGLPVESVPDLHCLRGLTALTLSTAFAQPLSEATLRQLEPPSALFPLLTRFYYSHDDPGFLPGCYVR